MMHDDKDKPCLKCVIKHMLNAKTYLMEATQFGYDSKVSTDEMDSITLGLCNIALKKT